VAGPAIRKPRALHTPRRISVESATESGDPIAVVVSGRRLEVEGILERWRIDDEWWRERPISRLYYRLLLEDGRTMDVYQALRTGRWFRQAY
jgi:protein ImuB